MMHSQAQRLMPIIIQVENRIRENIGLLECWTGLATDETFSSSTFCTTCESIRNCVELYALLKSSRGNLHPASLAKRIAVYFDIDTEYMKSQLEMESSGLVVVRDASPRTGIPKCVSCDGYADDVHEIIPRSSFGKENSNKCFDIKNRCCLCRKCHDKAVTEMERGRLLHILEARYKYIYDEEPWKWLLENYRKAIGERNGKAQ